MNKEIITVDDAATIPKMVSMTLGSAGYRIPETTNGLEGIESVTLAPVIQEDEQMNNSVATRGKPSISSNSIRVDVGLLDRVMNTVASWRSPQTQTLRTPEQIDSTTLQLESDRLNIITTCPQDMVTI